MSFDRNEKIPGYRRGFFWLVTGPESIALTQNRPGASAPALRYLFYAERSLTSLVRMQASFGRR